jgi:rhamnose transport system ATP-binding protein
VGAGRTELMQALSGVSHPSSGEIVLNGKPMLSPARRRHQRRYRLRAGRAAEAGGDYRPADRPEHQPAAAQQTQPNGVLNDAREWRLADEYASRLQVKAFSWRQAVETLSGGNQQKVVIGKWLATHPEVIILDEPTKGIDIGSKRRCISLCPSWSARGWR